MPASWERVSYVLNVLKLQILTLMGREPLSPRALLSHCLLVQKGLLCCEILSTLWWSISFKERLFSQPEIIIDTSIKHKVSIFRMTHSTKNQPCIIVKGSNFSFTGVGLLLLCFPSLFCLFSSSSTNIILLFSFFFQQHTEFLGYSHVGKYISKKCHI